MGRRESSPRRFCGLGRSDKIERRGEDRLACEGFLGHGEEAFAGDPQAKAFAKPPFLGAKVGPLLGVFLGQILKTAAMRQVPDNLDVVLEESGVEIEQEGREETRERRQGVAENNLLVVRVRAFERSSDMVAECGDAVAQSHRLPELI